MSVLFNSFETWKNACKGKDIPLFRPVIDFEITQKGRQEEEIWEGLKQAYQVMKEAVDTGLNQDMDFPFRNDQ